MGKIEKLTPCKIETISRYCMHKPR